MTQLQWRPMALADRNVIMEYIGQDNPAAAASVVDPSQCL